VLVVEKAVQKCIAFFVDIFYSQRQRINRSPEIPFSGLLHVDIRQPMGEDAGGRALGSQEQPIELESWKSDLVPLSPVPDRYVERIPEL